ncbi:MAG TPA: phage holin family protein [Burkholderiales bacterium]|nr:phage holin family protein [Burkholderiales bacterium]
MSESAPGEAGAGIVQSLRSLAATLVALLRTRAELLATEIEEERVRLLQLLFWAAAALFFLGVGVLLLVILYVAAFWDSYRIPAIVALAVIFLAAGAGMAIGVRNRMYARPRLFSASLDELARDKDQLTPR